jgi:hypothetical protein
MTRAPFLGIRLAVLLLAVVPAVGCGGPTQYNLKVDNPAVPFKPADPDDLVVEDDDEDEDAEGGTEDSAGEE